MPSLHDLVLHLNDLFKVDQIKDYGPNGLQVDSDQSKISLVATAVSASLETIEQAVKHKVDVLLVHHGLFWESTPRPIVGTLRKKVQKLLDHKIALLAYHLPMDAHPLLGNNWTAAKDLGWSDLKPFGSIVGDTPIGVQGVFPPLPVSNFQTQLENYYKHPATVALGGPAHVQSAALISGGAHREFIKAKKAGVDCFITGSFDEPIWHLAKEENIHFFAMGHSNTEEVGPKALGKYLEETFGLKHIFLNLPNPF